MAQFEGVDFPGWEVVRKIGEGSFGGVYEIHRTLPGGRVEKCALKKLSVPRNDGEIQELISQSFSTESITAHYKNQMGELVNEYSLTQELSSCKNVVGCYDVRFIQHDDGIGWDIYIRMELLNPLRQALSAEYQEATVLRLGLDMCNALLACQEHSIIHRDIKPENILVSDRGEFKLGDFGIAKVSERTGTGTMTGTMGYMAPEVANRQHYGPQADIYSLGMVLYWMMNRRTLPFLPLPPSIPTGAQRQQAQDRRLSGEPLPPPIDGSEALRKIVLKACAFSPAERYRSAEEMQAALQSCMSTPAAPRMQRQKPMAPPAPISEPTVIDTPTELEREPAVHANAPRQAQQIPEQQGRQQMAEKQTPEKEAPKKDAPPKKQKKPVIYHVMVSLIAVALILACCGIGVVIFSYAERRAEAAKTEQAYQAALVLMEEGNYSDAADAFAALGDYGDSAAKEQEARQMQETVKNYQAGLALMEEGNYSDAADAFAALGDYGDSAAKEQEARQALELKEKEDAYQAAQTLMDKASYQEAAEAFEVLGSYNDSEEKAKEARNQLSLLESYQSAQALLNQEDYQAAAEAFEALGDYNDSAEKAEEARGLQERKESIRVLREDIAWAEYLGDDNWNYPPVLGSSVTRDEVTAIVFRDTTKDAPKDAWDVSKNGDRSVLAWTSGPRGYYTLVIAAKGGVSAPENCYLLFADYPNVTSIQFNGAFDTSKVTDMGCMFSGCENLSSLNLSGFDTSKVTNMGCMFSGCESLTSLDVSSFNTSKAENMFSMFDGCEKLASLDVRGFDTSKVTNMCSMFSGCEKLASLNLSSFDTSNVEYMNCMFFYCKKLASLDMSSFDTSNVTDMALMFTGCENLFSLNLSSFDTSKVTGMSSMFSGCEKLTSLNLNGFDTSKVTDMSEMFSGCKKLASLNVNSFDTSKVENMRSMFNGCEKLTSLNLSGFKTSNVTDMHGMFSGCENLASLNVNSFDTSKVTDMSWMFNSCEKLASLDLSSFKTSKVTRMTFMFDGCDSLRYLNLGWFDTSSVTDYDYFMGDNITYNGRPWLELFE